MADFRLPKRARLVKTDEISSVFSFSQRYTGKYIQLLVMPGPFPVGRIAVIVSKKIVRFATQRNFIKRACRETYRIHFKQHFQGLDVVVRVRRHFDRTSSLEALADLEMQFIRAAPNLHQAWEQSQ